MATSPLRLKAVRHGAVLPRRPRALKPLALGLAVCALAFMTTPACGFFDHLRQDSVQLHSGDAVVVAAVSGGDELMVRRDGAEFAVRLLGVQGFDPVMSDPYIQAQSRRAREFLQARVGQQAHVYFDVARSDTQGRFSAYVEVEKEELNLAMVREGIAPVYTEYPFSHEVAYLEAERRARATRAGIWSDAKTVNVVSGLRREWARARKNRHALMVPDPLSP